jgi:hypothetical protein
MKHFCILTVAAILLTAWGPGREAAASRKDRIAHREAQTYPWHGDYYDTGWGMPVSTVVPPTAEHQTNWGSGVGGTTVTPIQHQYNRNFPGPGEYQRSWFRPTPPWPSNTKQFGDYYNRGPW